MDKIKESHFEKDHRGSHLEQLQDHKELLQERIDQFTKSNESLASKLPKDIPAPPPVVVVPIDPTPTPVP